MVTTQVIVKKEKVERMLLQTAFLNLFIVALLGISLRAAPLVDRFPFVYKNLLHGHSHFAFGGWVLPVLIALVMKTFPEIKEGVSAKHWRNIALLTLVSAYGMLVFFPLYGYKGISIFFSTLSIVATVYFAVVVWKAMKKIDLTIAHRFLIWSLIYGVLSAIGPFATVPLIVTGKQGTPLYFDLIYFYLHFQYNGFFTFTILALWYKRLPGKGAKVFRLLNVACMPAYALSVLWHQPSTVFNIIGGFAAILQMAAFYFLWLDVKVSKLSTLFYFSFLAFALKVVLQAAGAFPSVALIAYEVRNFVITYLHLVLLGFISVAVFNAVMKSTHQPLFKLGVCLFLFSFLATESLLLLQALNSASIISLQVAYSLQMLLGLSLPFAFGALLMTVAITKGSQIDAVYKSFLSKERMASQSGTAIQSSITAKV